MSASLGNLGVICLVGDQGSEGWLLLSVCSGRHSPGVAHELVRFCWDVVVRAYPLLYSSIHAVCFVRNHGAMLLPWTDDDGFLTLERLFWRSVSLTVAVFMDDQTNSGVGVIYIRIQRDELLSSRKKII